MLGSIIPSHSIKSVKFTDFFANFFLFFLTCIKYFLILKLLNSHPKKGQINETAHLKVCRDQSLV